MDLCYINEHSGMPFACGMVGNHNIFHLIAAVDSYLVSVMLSCVQQVAIQHYVIMR